MTSKRHSAHQNDATTPETRKKLLHKTSYSSICTRNNYKHSFRSGAFCYDLLSLMLDTWPQSTPILCGPKKAGGMQPQSRSILWCRLLRPTR